ncbi:RNA polymerase sigma factor [Arthrobacter sp. zg-Y820]|uniref:RNA polymerase sigma factor n=1 Tax=unclassified Arthrobacter TaxID=235627 RepID=UPI001E3BA84A|nr:MULTISPECIES: RNA polymerase sigma factor [unclassified Arthrobacter]MCC9197223.1 RNA polymerase sigma factor [Arthrobacter sp. zg-Y820]MDK1280088.1 RNA polymerase sigma factor [Arthrobacter sp. zg.Y820]WIB09381.1 RNA polymerase sigma factor [Arthrobacter sp. zg-Y820]
MATAESPEESGTYTQSRRPAFSGKPGTLSGLDEATIVARAQDGDLAAFEHLVETYQGRLFRLAYRMLNDRGEAEDVVQDTLTAGWRALPGLDRSGAFGGWVYRTATNRCLDVLRRRSAHPEDSMDSAGLWPALAVQSGDPHRNAEIAAEFECLSRALAALPPGQRACWLLRELHDQSYAEIGAALGISPVTVRGRLARAREKLAEAMIQWH